MDINYLKRPQTIRALEYSRGNEPIDSDVHASTFQSIARWLNYECYNVVLVTFSNELCIL